MIHILSSECPIPIPEGMDGFTHGLLGSHVIIDRTVKGVCKPFWRSFSRTPTPTVDKIVAELSILSINNVTLHELVHEIGDFWYEDTTQRATEALMEEPRK